MTVAPRHLIARPAVRRIPAGLPSGPSLLALAVLAVSWELIGQVGQASFFPPLSVVLARLWELTVSGTLPDVLVYSLTNLVIGFAISVVFGVGIGLLMGMSRKIDAALDIYVNALLSAPPIIFAPIFFTIWGLGRETTIALIVQYSVFVIILNAAAAVRTTPVSLVEMAGSFNATRMQLLRHVIVPAATPLTMAGIRLGVGRAVKGMINGEQFIAIVGLGKLVEDAGTNLDAATILAVLIVICVVSFIAVDIVQIVDRRLTSWLPPDVQV